MKSVFLLSTENRKEDDYFVWKRFVGEPGNGIVPPFQGIALIVKFGIHLVVIGRGIRAEFSKL